MMDKDVVRYLNDHLAGSSAALLLVQELADSHDAPEAREFFLNLKKTFETERSVLADLLERIGHDPSALHKMAGEIAARITSIKLMWEQIEPGKLGLFEALELLALGVEGKRMLWGALREIAAWFPEWEGIDIEELDSWAIQQRDDIEFWRIKAAKDTLADVKRRSGVPLRSIDADVDRD